MNAQAHMEEIWMREPPAQRHSPTSVAAAKQIRKHLGPLHARILAFLATRPEGATDLEMQAELKMDPSTQRPRRIELLAMGKIESFGTTRPTPSGRAAVVWHRRQA
jgi:hypothetical protein